MEKTIPILTLDSVRIDTHQESPKPRFIDHCAVMHGTNTQFALHSSANVQWVSSKFLRMVPRSRNSFCLSFAEKVASPLLFHNLWSIGFVCVYNGRERSLFISQWQFIEPHKGSRLYSMRLCGTPGMNPFSFDLELLRYVL